MSTWFKFPCAYWSDPRQLRLWRELGDAALWLPARLWTFAATFAESGKLAEYSPSDLARLLEYVGDGGAMIVALQAAGYLDKKCRIVGWAELYSLPASRQLAAKTGAAARWAKRASTADDTHVRNQKEEKEKIEEREAHALRDGMRDASSHILPHSLTLTKQEIAQTANDFKMTPEGVAEALRVFNEIKTNFLQDARTLQALRGWLRTSKIGKDLARRFSRGSPNATNGAAWQREPPFDWRAWLREERPPEDYPGRQIWEDGPWIDIGDTWKEEIWAKARAPADKPGESTPR
jgi:hypothetical protein